MGGAETKKPRAGDEEPRCQTEAAFEEAENDERVPGLQVSQNSGPFLNLVSL